MRTASSRTTLAARGLGVALVAAVSVGAGCTMDPVGAAREADMERREVPELEPNSEFHRPGQDCIACHGPRGSAKSKFVVAGTVFWSRCLDPEGGPELCNRQGVNRAEVRLIAADDVQRCIRTNCAGNFFIREREWGRGAPDAKPLFPLLTSVRKVTAEGADREKVMAGHIGRTGSCNDCHRVAPFWNSAGQIYLERDIAQVPASAATETQACLDDHPPTPEEEDCPTVPGL